MYKKILKQYPDDIQFLNIMENSKKDSSKILKILSIKNNHKKLCLEINKYFNIYKKSFDIIIKRYEEMDIDTGIDPIFKK